VRKKKASEQLDAWEINYRGYGDPLIGFCPYLRHAQESGGGGPSPLILARSPHSEMGTDTTRFSTDLRLEPQKKHRLNQSSVSRQARESAQNRIFGDV
jgi:hypothetical protein